jgi:hypothetical protein
MHYLNYYPAHHLIPCTLELVDELVLVGKMSVLFLVVAGFFASISVAIILLVSTTIFSNWAFRGNLSQSHVGTRKVTTTPIFLDTHHSVC